VLAKKKNEEKKKLKLRTVDERSASTDLADNNQTPNSIRVKSPSLPLKSSSDLGNFALGDQTDQAIAEQLTLIEWEIFCKIHDSEFHHSNWKNDSTKKFAKNVCAMVDRFNVVSYWVATEIVMQTDLKMRVSLLKKFSQIAECMRDLGNFNGLMEIIGGLNSMSVQRLKATWEV